MFDFELVDTSFQGEVEGPRADEHDRLMRVDYQLRKELAISGKFRLLDIADQCCGARQQITGLRRLRRAICRQLGADLAITGTVQKVSNLILNINQFLLARRPYGDISSPR